MPETAGPAPSGVVPSGVVPSGVVLGELAEAIGAEVFSDEVLNAADKDLVVTDITHDSKQCGSQPSASQPSEPGMMFACVVGANHDGHDFAAEAVQAGATSLLVQRRLETLSSVPQLVVEDVRETLGLCASAIHHYPAQRINVVGITGTAGKTTVCHAIAQMLNATGRTADVLGTLDGARTTPEATDLNRWLAQLANTGLASTGLASTGLANNGASTGTGTSAQGDSDKPYAVIEVSSHALELGRVNGISFAAAVFTNLSQEHLDFHGDMETYFQAKAKLFDGSLVGGHTAAAVINVGNEWGLRLHEQLAQREQLAQHVQPTQRKQRAVPPQSIHPPKLNPYGSTDLSDAEIGRDYLRFTWRNRRLTSRLRGRFNLENLAAAATTCLALGLSEDEVAVGLESVQPVRGRMQPVIVPESGTVSGEPANGEHAKDEPASGERAKDEPASGEHAKDEPASSESAGGQQGPTVLVDYAHKPEALAAALASARELATASAKHATAEHATSEHTTTGRLWVVFGAGGDRDKSKRPLMGKTAAALADFVIITSDNSRSEDPAAIAAEIEAGCANGAAQIRRVIKREEAIEYAITNAQPADVVLIAGKGHESTQVDSSGSKPFDDAKVAAAMLSQKTQPKKTQPKKTPPAEQRSNK